MIVLDTHTWIWLVSEPQRLNNAVVAADAKVVSSISAWEVATKATQNKLVLDRPILDWVVAAHAEHDIRSEPISMQIAIRAGILGAEGFHGDPADRIIVATALLLRCPIATKDDKIRDWAIGRNDLSIVW